MEYTFFFRKDDPLSWDDVASVVNGYREHLERLGNPFIESLVDSDIGRVQEYLEMYDLSKGLSDKVGTVKILKFGTPQTIAIIVLKIEKFDVTLH